MAVQTTYSERITAAQEGQLVDQEPHRIVSRIVEDAAGIGFGKVALRGAGARGVKAPVADAAAFVGITLRNPTVDPELVDKYAQYDHASILLEGVVWVVAGAAVVAGDDVLYNDTTGAYHTTTGAGSIAIPNAIFDAGAAQGALVPIRIRM